MAMQGTYSTNVCHSWKEYLLLESMLSQLILHGMRTKAVATWAVVLVVAVWVFCRDTLLYFTRLMVTLKVTHSAVLEILAGHILESDIYGSMFMKCGSITWQRLVQDS